MPLMPTANTADFNARWAKWVGRGLANDQRARRRFVWSAVAIVMIAMIAMVAAAVYLIVR